MTRRRSAKPLLVGEASNLPDRGEAFRGRSGRFLARLLGVDLAEFHWLFDCVNLLYRRQGKRSGARKGDLFDAAAAKRAARRLDVRGRVVVLAGKRVARAFGLADPPWLRRIALGRGEASCFVVPHPSGIVTWYNELLNRRRVAKLLRRLARGR